MAQSKRRGLLRTGVSLIAAGLLVGSTGVVAAAATPGSTAAYGGYVYTYHNVERDGERIRDGFDDTTLEAGDIITDVVCYANSEDYSRDLVGTYRVKIGDGTDYDATVDLSDRSAFRPAANYVITSEDISRGYIESSCTFAGLGFADASERYSQTITTYLHVDAADDDPAVDASASIALNDQNGDGIASRGEVVDITVTMENLSTAPTAVAGDRDIYMFDSVNDARGMSPTGNEWLFPTALGPGGTYSETWEYTVTVTDEQNRNLPNIRASWSPTSSAGSTDTFRAFSAGFPVGPWADLAPDVADFTAANEGDVTLGADTAEAGTEVDLTIPALSSNERFSAFLFDAAGDFTRLADEARYRDPSSLTIPAATTAGTYRVGVYRPNGVALGWDGLTVSGASGGTVTPNAGDFTMGNQGGLIFYGDAQPAPGDAFRVGVDNASNGDAVVVYLFDEADQPRLLADVNSYGGAIDVNYPGDLPTGDYKVGVYSADGSVLGWDTRSVFGASVDVPVSDYEPDVNDNPADGTAGGGDSATGTPSEDDLTADTEGKITATPSTFKPGDRVTIKVNGASEGERFTVVIFSEPTPLGTHQTDASGHFSVSTPSDLPEGVHSIAVYDVDGNMVGWQRVIASADAGLATDPGDTAADADASASAQDESLAETGASDLSAKLAFSASMLVLAGMALTGFAVAGRRME